MVFQVALAAGGLGQRGGLAALLLGLLDESVLEDVMLREAMRASMANSEPAAPEEDLGPHHPLKSRMRVALEHAYTFRHAALSRPVALPRSDNGTRGAVIE